MKPRLLAVRLNDEETRVPEGTTLEELLERAELARGLVAVEVGGEVVGRAAWERPLREGDEIRAFRLVGGG